MIFGRQHKLLLCRIRKTYKAIEDEKLQKKTLVWGAAAAWVYKYYADG